MNLIQQIDQFASKHPDKVVYDYLGKTNTYGQLHNLSNQLAEKIQSLGLTTGSPIIVYGGQTFDMLVAFLASVKTGHAYIPVDRHSRVGNAGASDPPRHLHRPGEHDLDRHRWRL